jgi:hypothetical protein
LARHCFVLRRRTELDLHQASPNPRTFQTFKAQPLVNPLDAFWHIANFFAPAWGVAAILALAAKLLWRQSYGSVAWGRLALWGGLGGSLGLLAALALLGRDGKMLGYGLMLLTVALPQWILGLRLRK